MCDDMDLFICIPILFGCPTKVKPEGDQTPRVCPRCNNASVVSASARTWFELCFVPLIPMSKKHIWVCGICQWQMPRQQGWEPAIPGPGFAAGWQGQAPPQQGWYGAPPQGPVPMAPTQMSPAHMSPQATGYGQPYPPPQAQYQK